MSKRDYYEVLGVARQASDDELKKAYRRCAMKHHPDRNPGDAGAEAAFKECKEAYEVLADPARRRAYDAHGHAAFEHGMGGGGAGAGPDMNDIFGDIFGSIFGGAGGGPRAARRGADIGYVMELDLEEAVAGAEKRIDIPTLAECAPCKGSGSEDGKVETCGACQGRGQVRFQRDGDDLYCEVPIRFSQAALGADLVVPTLDGEALIKVPKETQTGKLFRLRGKGVRSVRSQAAGDLMCRLVVETPVNLTSRQRELLEEFEGTFEGEQGARHSPRSSGFLDGVKAFWDRMTS